KQQSGQTYNFELSGQTTGYIAAGVSNAASESARYRAYVCANHNSAVRFFTGFIENQVLNLTETLTTSNVKGSVTSGKIQCTFSAALPDTTTRAAAYALSVTTGNYNPNSKSTTTAAPANNETTAAPANNGTTAAPANNGTTAAPANKATTIAPNTLPPVASISRQECGSSKLCAAEPTKCDPASGDCYFLSAKQQSGQKYNFELSGQTTGYIAAGLSNAAIQTVSHRAYVCANHNGAVRFFTGFIKNLVLNLTETLDSSNERGSVNSGKIQCTFSAVLPDPFTRAAGYSMSITIGPYNASSGQPGPANSRIQTPVVNLSDPTANATNLLSN
uniref:Uncharacterized protein n=1 Tax=Poecilia formosa TaxID=48698 RepID=A0A096LSU0_POEFO